MPQHQPRSVGEVMWIHTWVQTKESAVEGSAWGPAQSQPRQPVCEVADAENGDKYKCATNSSHLHQHPTTDRASEISYKI